MSIPWIRKMKRKWTRRPRTKLKSFTLSEHIILKPLCSSPPHTKILHNHRFIKDQNISSWKKRWLMGRTRTHVDGKTLTTTMCLTTSKTGLPAQSKMSQPRQVCAVASSSGTTLMMTICALHITVKKMNLILKTIIQKSSSKSSLQNNKNRIRLKHKLKLKLKCQ